MSFSTATVSGKLSMILLARPAPLAILLMTGFYLWLFWRGVPGVAGDVQ
jgi:sensor domain CHASE-containing protein